MECLRTTCPCCYELCTNESESSSWRTGGPKETTNISVLSAYSLIQHGQKHSFVYLYWAGFSPSTIWPSAFIFCQFEYSNSHLSVWAIPGSCKCAGVAPVAETLCLQWHNVFFLFASGVGGEGLAVDKWSQTKERHVLHIFIEVDIFFLFRLSCDVWIMFCYFLLGNVALTFAVCCIVILYGMGCFGRLLFLLEGKLSP